MNRRWLGLLLSPLGLVLLSAARLLVISDFSPTTATTIASSGGYINTLLGSVIPLVPIFIPYIALALLLARQFFLSIVAFTFTVFIAPTTMKLPVTRDLATADIHHLIAQAETYWPITLLLAVLIFVLAYLHHGSLIEALATILALAVAASILFAPAVAHLTLPHSLHSAAADVDRIITAISASPWRAVGLGVVVAALLLIGHSGSVPGAVTTAVALIVAIVLTPYLYDLYPLPGRSSYYVDVLRSPWLPSEKFALSAGHNYYGYALSTSDGWFTILLSKDRTIVYVPADHVVRQAVCETASQAKVPADPPLITTFYTKPPRIRACADRKYLRKHPHPGQRPGPPRRHHSIPFERRPPGRTGDD